MPTTNANPLLIDRREIYRSSTRGTPTGSSGFSDALNAMGPAAESAASELVTGKGVVSAALSTGMQSLTSGGGGVVAQGLGSRIPGVPTMGGNPASGLGGDPTLNSLMQQGNDQTSQMQMFMLLEKTQRESLYWQSVTNISKTSHETKMNAVRNLKS